MRKRQGILKFPFALIQQDRDGFVPAGEDEIDGAVVIDVARDCSEAIGEMVEAGFLAPIGECFIAVISPEDVCGFGGAGRRSELLDVFDRIIGEAGGVEIEIAVVIVIDEGETHHQAVHVDA